MSLYGALFASVAGLQVQSNRIGAISDNIANVNTVGYKSTGTAFQTLVTSSGQASSFSPGGVLSTTISKIDQQGQIQGTSSGTDLAISGNGFFVVKNGLTSSATTFYTRAGSFSQDSLGNFVNTSGFYLLGWPLDRNGNLPGAPGNPNTNSANNLSSLEVVNVVSATGSAADTTSVSVSANLKASQTAYPGAGATATMDTLSVNYHQPSASIIVPDELNQVALSTNQDDIQRGDTFSVTTSSGTSVFTYGGFSYTRDVTNGLVGDSGQDVRPSPITLGVTPFTTTNVGTAASDGTTDGKTVKVTAGNHGLAVGDVVTFSGEAVAVNNVPANDFNQKFVVTSIVDSDHFTIRVADPANATGAGGTTGVTAVTRPFAGNILDATTADTQFLATTGTSGFTSAGLTFTINTTATGTVTFTYTSATPNPQIGQFSTLNNLVTAVNAVQGLSARVVNGRLYIGAADANASVTFANGSAAGTAGPPVQAGIDWVGELGLSNITAGTSRFNSLDSLKSAVDATGTLSGTITNPLTNATLDINVADPLDTITYTDPTAQTPIDFSTGSITTQTGSSASLVQLAAPTGFPSLSAGDLITLDATGMTGYPSLYNATGQFATTNTSTTVTITKAAHGFANGDVIHIDATTLTGWPNGTISGIPLTDFNGNFTVSGVTANTFDITVADAANATSAGTGTGSTTISPTIGGIPLTDFNGQFVVQQASGTTYSIAVAHPATSAATVGATGLFITPPSNQGSLLSALGLASSLQGAAYTPQSLGPIGPQYDPNDPTKNMAGGAITPQFSQDVRIFDSLGSGHDLKVSFIKTATNTWAVEVYAINTSDVATTFVNGLLASGTLSFNGDGSLRSVSAGLASSVSILWQDGASPSSVTFNWGTAGVLGTGKTDGMTQFDADFAINFINQNGTAVGQLTSVSVTADGYVVANFNNGQSQRLYQIPLAVFSAPDQLQASNGNVFSQTNNSGTPNLRQAGSSGAGKFQPSALETSVVDLASELTDLIVAQRAYEANTKLITIAGSLLQTLNQSIQG